MFLKLDEIARKLDQIFLPLEQDGITGMRLLPQKDALALMQAQETLGVNLPAKFTELLSKFELGNFEICNVSFGSRGDYASELVRLNSVDEFGGKWWSGEVYAWLLGDKEFCSRRVASDFEKFFIALASTYIARLSDETLPSAQQILNFVQADDTALDFWQETTQI